MKIECERVNSFSELPLFSNSSQSLNILDRSLMMGIVHRWKGNKIPSLDIHLFTPRHTFSKRKWHEKREISFSPPKSGIPSSSYIFKTVHISEKWLSFSWSAPYFCLRKAGDNWNVARKCKKNTELSALHYAKIAGFPYICDFLCNFFLWSTQQPIHFSASIKR